MRVLVIATILSACGQRVVYVGHVDTSIAGDFDALQSDMPDIIKRDASGVTLTVGTEALVDFYLDTGRPCVGLNDNGVITIAPAGVKIRLTEYTFTSLAKENVKVVIAHELGHALGLHHLGETGLMSPRLATECRGREAECLREALGGEHE